MPIFDFTCRDCGKRFDKFFRSTAGPHTATCPSCQSDKTDRALSRVNAGSGEKEASLPQPMCGKCGVPGGPCAMN
jgi:putative FmdB family regulatory protein